MKKRIIAFVLVMNMLAGMIPGAVFAADAGEVSVEAADESEEVIEGVIISEESDIIDDDSEDDLSDDDDDDDDDDDIVSDEEIIDKDDADNPADEEADEEASEEIATVEGLFQVNLLGSNEDSQLLLSASECIHNYNNSASYALPALFEGYGSGNVRICNECGAVKNFESWGNGNEYPSGSISIDLETKIITVTVGGVSKYVQNGTEITQEPEATPDPEIAALIEKIINLPDPYDYTSIKYNDIAAAASVLGTANTIFYDIEDLSDDLKDQLKTGYPADYQKLLDVISECKKICDGTYSPEPEPTQKVYVEWNDNQENTERRTPANKDTGGVVDFIDATNPTVSYKVYRVTAGGRVEVDSGSASSVADVKAHFDSLGIVADSSNPLITCAADGESAKYAVSVSEVPVAFERVYENPSTGEVSTDRFEIDYSISFAPVDNPYYVTTLPSVSDGVYTVPCGTAAGNNNRLILTALDTDWTATVSWLDDDNRPALDGESRPRPTADELKGKIQVYRHTTSYNDDSLIMSVDSSLVNLSVTDNNDGSYSVSLSGMPLYDNDGNPVTYFVRLDDVASKAEAGDYYSPTYSNVSNFSAKTAGLYEKGTVLELLTGSVPFTVKKVWDDGLSAEEGAAQRPDSAFIVWCMTEHYGENVLIEPLDYTKVQFSVPNTSEKYNIQKDVNSGEPVLINMGNENAAAGEGIVGFKTYDKYDSLGRRFIYYGAETGVGNGYTTIIDNSGASFTRAEVISSQFGTNSRFFINGATVTNFKEHSTTASFTKTFNAPAVQNFDGLSASFSLMKKVGESGSWVPAVEADKEAPDGAVPADTPVSVTLDGFTAEVTSKSYTSPAMKKQVTVDGVTEEVEYMWVETGMALGSDSASVSHDDSFNYSDTVLNDIGTGKAGPEGTTALFSTDYSQEASGGSFINTMMGQEDVVITKTFSDETGDITGNKDRIAELFGDSVTFRIYREDSLGAKVNSGTAGAITDLSGNNVSDVVMTFDNNYSADISKWIETLNLPRYDELGCEYRYTVREINAGATWTLEENYSVDYPNVGTDENPVYIKRVNTAFHNGIGEGGVLHFDATKEWLDNSDSDNRKPINYTVFRIAEPSDNAAGFVLLDPPVAVASGTLNAANNWFNRSTVAANDKEINGTVYPDSTDNYLLVETSITAVSAPASYADVNYDNSASSMKDIISAMSAAKGADSYIGIAGSTEREGENWDHLDYRYRVYERLDPDETKGSVASYIITNVRIAQQTLKFVKTWAAAGDVTGA